MLEIAYGVLQVVLLFVGARATAMLVRRADPDWTRAFQIRRTWQILGLVGALVIRAIDVPGVTVLEASTLSVPESGVIVLNALVLTVFALSNVVAVRHGVRLLTSDYPHYEGSLWWQYDAVNAGLLFVLWLGFEATVYHVLPVSWVWLFGLGIGVRLAKRRYQKARAPLTMGFLRRATDEERQRVASAYETFGREVPDVLVNTFGRSTAVHLSGLGSCKYVDINEEFVAGASDDELATALLQADELRRNGYTLYSEVVSALTIVTYLGTFVAIAYAALAFAGGMRANPTLPVVSSALPPDPAVQFTAISLVLVAVLVGATVLVESLLITRWMWSRVFDADAHASEEYGVATVRTVYEQVGDRLSMERGVLSEWIPGIPGVAPPMADRIDRLNESDIRG